MPKVKRTENQIKKFQLTEAELMILKIVKDNDNRLTTGYVGLYAWGGKNGKHRQPQAYAMSAGKILKRLKLRGLTYESTTTGWSRWKLTNTAINLLTD